MAKSRTNVREEPISIDYVVHRTAGVWKIGDIVTIRSAKLGALVNRVTHSDKAAPWTFGATALMRNLAARGLLQ